jgi:hypothetical protein
MRSSGKFWSRIPTSGAAYGFFTLVAWTTAAFLFVLLKRVRSVSGASLITQPVFLVSLVPWLAGTVFLVKLRKRVKLGKTDQDTAGFCCTVLYSAVCSAYVAMQLIGILLLQVLSRAT